jgi:hypothetical protein
LKTIVSELLMSGLPDFEGLATSDGSSSKVIDGPFAGTRELVASFMEQITSDYRKSCQVQKFGKSKIFPFSLTPNHRHIFAHPVLPRGALAIVTNVGRVAVDARVATDERSLSVR